MNFHVTFLISISMNYATKLSTGCRQICRCCGTRTDRQVWIKLRFLLSYCRFLSAPYSRLFNAAQDLELTVQQFTLEGGSVLGGWKCRGRVELFALCLKVLVRACRIALHGQNRPPGTRSPSAAEKGDKNTLPRRLRGGRSLCKWGAEWWKWWQLSAKCSKLFHLCCESCNMYFKSWDLYLRSGGSGTSNCQFSDGC